MWLLRNVVRDVSFTVSETYSTGPGSEILFLFLHIRDINSVLSCVRKTWKAASQSFMG